MQIISIQKTYIDTIQSKDGMKLYQKMSPIFCILFVVCLVSMWYVNTNNDIIICYVIGDSDFIMNL